MSKYFLSFFSGLCGAILFIVLYSNMYMRSIGVLHMDEVIGSHIQIEGVKEMSKEDTQKNAKLFSAALESSINEISDEYKVTLLVNPAVVTPMPDYTDLVKERIKLKMDSK